jgi:hypothetical protein
MSRPSRRSGPRRIFECLVQRLLYQSVALTHCPDPHCAWIGATQPFWQAGIGETRETCVPPTAAGFRVCQ